MTPNGAPPTSTLAPPPSAIAGCGYPIVRANQYSMESGLITRTDAKGCCGAM